MVCYESVWQILRHFKIEGCQVIITLYGLAQQRQIWDGSTSEPRAVFVKVTWYPWFSSPHSSMTL